MRKTGINLTQQIEHDLYMDGFDHLIAFRDHFLSQMREDVQMLTQPSKEIEKKGFERCLS